MITQMSDMLPCPKCGTVVRFRATSVIDVDDQPDRRDEIVERTLSQEECEKCGTLFRMQPTFAYFDREHDQWIGAFPWNERDRWRECEEQGHSLYEIYLNADTAMAARMREAPLNRRVTFGWEALREKIVAAGRGLDDVTLELAKRELSPPLSLWAKDDSDVRLLVVDKAELILGRVVPPSEEIVDRMPCPRAHYDAIAGGGAAVQRLRRELSQGTYVDLRRLSKKRARG